MKVKDEKDNKDIIEGFEKFLDEKQSKSIDQKGNTQNNTNTLSRKRERENDNQNENKSEPDTKKVFLYNPDEDSENEIKEDSSSCSEDIIFCENYYDKEYDNEEERLENFYDISDNKQQ